MSSPRTSAAGCTAAGAANVGKVVGSYVLGTCVGTGHFGTVHQAKQKDQDGGPTVAVKVVSKGLLQREGKEDAMRKEIGILQSLRHPHIVELVEVLQSANTVYIVLEHVEGGDFLELLQQVTRLDESTARRYFQQLMSAVDYCHQRGIAHRDLKCENLLLTKAGTLKVSDFGLSTLQRTRDTGEVSASLMLDSVVGSPHYLAPEVLAGEGYSGFCADVWACGVILYMMLSGRMPFDEPTVMETLHKICDGTFRFTEHFEPLSRRLITRMLVAAPQRRLTVPQVLAHEWTAKDLDPSLLGHRRSSRAGGRIETLADPLQPGEGGPEGGTVVVEACHDG
eukprot:TRINITY_DN9244_c0_g1_i1.p1 TRINITY_DN9244_c0_g1~~TRINITY_DN9244_c0_g1_i1.p1  ORF type:complete len:371 (+),score=115.78 TRINITY_DN9244_c0_g1_i1:103-1113(+)